MSFIILPFRVHPKILMLGVLFFIWRSSLSQDTSKYFDDGGITNRTKIIKIGFDPVNGELPLIFEHTITKRFTLEWGAGPVSLARQTNRYRDEPLPIDPTGLGFTLWTKIKFYLKGDYEKWHIGFQPKVTFMSGTSFVDINFFNGGYQFLIDNRWVIDFEAGMGVRTFKHTTLLGSVPYTERDSRFFLPVLVKFGYIF